MALRSFLNLQDEVLALGFDAATYRSRVKVWLNEALHRIARTSHLDDDAATLTTTADARYVSLPSQVLRIISVVDDQQQFLEPLDLIDFQSRIALAPTASGRPASYVLQQGRMQFFPLPDRAYALVVSYRSNPPSFVNDGDTVATIGLPEGMDDYCHVLVDWAAAKAYRNEDDAEMANYYMGEFQREFMVLRGDLGIPVEVQLRQIPGLHVTGTPNPRFRMPGR